MADNVVEAANTPEPKRSPADLKLIPSHSYRGEGFDSIRLPPSLTGASFGFFNDPEIIAQFDHPQLASMMARDFGFRFVADVDRNEEAEIYQTGWLRTAKGQILQFLAVSERGIFKDIWVTDADELQSISWHSGKPTIFDCNCPKHAPIIYRNGKLDMAWIE